MSSLIVLLVVLGCVALLYFKSTLVESFALVIIVICAGIVAFSYFEPLASVLIKRKIFASWSFSISFILLFILAFAVFQAIAAYLTRKPVDFGMLPERIGRVVFGIFLGLMISGFLMTAIAMAPISPKYPYQRFDQNNPNMKQTGRSFLNIDGFATGWFNVISGGSLSGKKSFAVMHPDFLNQVFLNRQQVRRKVSIVVPSEVLKMPRQSVWPAPEELMGPNGEPVQSKNGYDLTIVRMGVHAMLMQYGGGFTPSQVRLICKPKNDKSSFTGKGKSVYPIGYLRTENELETTKLNDTIRPDYMDNLKEYDFVFYVPKNYVPVLIGFKGNVIAELPSPIKYEDAPPMRQPPQPEEPESDDS